jgi:chromosome segregation ATPase
MTESAAEATKLQKSLASLQSERTQLHQSLKTKESANDALKQKLLAMEKEHKRHIEEIKNQGEHELAALKNQDAKVVQAHHVLQKAHDVLQKRHQELKDQSVKEGQKIATESARLQKEFETCTEELATAQKSEQEMQKKQEALKVDAMKKGAEKSAAQFQGALKNLTATKETLEAKIKDAEAVVAEKTAFAKEARKDVPDMELKLRRCRESREKTELDFERVLKRCPQKGVFLQQWP